MEKITLIHPGGKSGVSMDKIKYETLATSFLSCLKKKEVASFDELLTDVQTDLEKRKQEITGKLHWNLFWVTLDLESKRQIKKDRSMSPIKYSIAKKL